jgi:GNAT superfamily N-acetyltransferase
MDQPIKKLQFIKRFFEMTGVLFQSHIEFMEDPQLTASHPMTLIRSNHYLVVKYDPSIKPLTNPELTLEDSNKVVVEAFLGVNTNWREDQNFVLFQPESVSLPPIQGLKVELLTIEKKMDLGKLKASCSYEEIEQSQVGLDDDIVLGIYHQKDLLAVGSLWFIEQDLADLHLLIHPRFRSIGLGKLLFGLLVNRAFQVNRIPMARGKLMNHAAYKAALSIGFVEAVSVFEIYRD